MNARKLFRSLTILAMSFLLLASRAAAQSKTINVADLPDGSTLSIVIEMDPKAGANATANVTSNGPVSNPDIEAFLDPNKPQVQMQAWKCPGPNGTIQVIFEPVGQPNPCPDGERLAVVWFGGNSGDVTINAAGGNITISQPPNAASASSTGTAPGHFGTTGWNVVASGFGAINFIQNTHLAEGGGDAALILHRDWFGGGIYFRVDETPTSKVSSFSGSATSATNSVGRTDIAGGGLLEEKFDRFSFDEYGGPVGAREHQKTVVCGGSACSSFSTNNTQTGYFFGVRAGYRIWGPISVFGGFTKYGNLNNSSAGSTLPMNYSSNQTEFGVQLRLHNSH